MAAVYGSSTNFWNVNISANNLKLQEILKGYFSTITLITGIVLVVLGPFIMFGNGIVIAAIWKDPFKQLRSSPSYIIIASMAVGDFFVGITAIIPLAFWFISTSVKAEISYHLAPVAQASGDLFLEASVLHVLALTIDRVLAVVNPLLYKPRVTRKRVLLSVIILWVVMFSVAFSQTILKAQHYYIFSVIAVSFVCAIALLTTCLCFVIIYKVRKRRQTKIMKTDRESCALGNRIAAERDRKTTQSILLVLLVFLVCCTMFLVSATVILTCSRCHPHLDVFITTYFLSLIVLHVNSAVNPILYALRLPRFRKPVALILKKIKWENVVGAETPSNIPQVNLNTASRMQTYLKTAAM